MVYQFILREVSKEKNELSGSSRVGKLYNDVSGYTREMSNGNNDLSHFSRGSK